MDRTPPGRAEGTWLAVFCTGVLVTALSATVCLGMIAFYGASLDAVEPVVACFAAGAVLMIAAAARLDRLNAARTAARGRDAR